MNIEVHHRTNMHVSLLASCGVHGGPAQAACVAGLASPTRPWAVQPMIRAHWLVGLSLASSPGSPRFGFHVWTYYHTSLNVCYNLGLICVLIPRGIWVSVS